MDHPFRTAAVGGFNRQDVLEYLGTVTREAAERQQQLQKQLDEAVQLAEQREQELSQLREQTANQEKELEELRNKLSQTEEALTSSRAEAEQSVSEWDTAHQEVEELRAQVAALKPGAQAYDAIKDRTAGVELEAHHRAQLVQQEAESQIKTLRSQTEQWMRRLGQEYDALRTQIEATVSHAADQLSRAEQNLEQVNELMEQQGLTLESLAQCYAETDPGHVEPATPLAEN